MRERAYRVRMTSTPIRAVCLDFDGTLAYMEPSHWALYAEAARRAGLEVSEDALASQAVDDAWAPWMTPLGPVHLDASRSQEAFRALRASLAADRIRAALPAGAVDAHALDEAGRIAATLEEEAARYVLFEDTRPALERLADAGVTAIIVSNHIWTLPEIVENRGLGDLVAATVTSARNGHRKPHPAIFEEALRRAGCAADEALFVGDTLAQDIAGANAMGMRSVLIWHRDDKQPALDSVRPAHVIRRIPELLDLL